MLKQIKLNKNYSHIRDIYYIDETGKVFSKRNVSWQAQTAVCQKRDLC